MVSYRKQTFFCCLGFLALLAIGAVSHAAAVLMPDGAEQARLLRAIGGFSLVLSLAPVVFLAVVLTRRMRTDLDRLRTGIHQLSLPDHELPDDSFRFEEFNECARKLREVAHTLNERQEQLSDGASRDALTGLPNRRTMKYVVSREVAFAERTGWPLSVVMVDLDHFKSLNDTYGHQAGDYVLERTARRLDSLVRNSDVVARYGGEEFVLIFPGTGLEQAVEISQQLRNALRCDRFQFDNQEITVTASFGVAELHSCGCTDVDALIARADSALYDAKHSGRDRVVAAPMMDGSAEHEVRQDEASTAAAAVGAHKPVAKVSDDPVDRDTMSLMGSIFSILQLIPDRQRVACDLVQQVAAVLQAPRAMLYAWDSQRGSLLPLASSRIEERDRLANFDTPPEIRDWFDGQRLGDSRRMGRNVDPEVANDSSDERGNKKTVRLPLMAYGELIGVVVSYIEEPEFEISARQQTILSALGTIGATALRTCDVYAQQEERWVGLIEALCGAIHSVDAFKRRHACRVADIAVIVARALGQQDRDELQLIRVAGLVHDIGKVGLPVALFKKKGRLRNAERTQMQEHCKIGANILASVPQLHRLATVVMHHHEHFDGGGYPEGLAGSEIPIESRIIAVADAYDAMTNERPFRAALSHDEAIRRIRESALSQFDPSVVNVFLDLFESQAHKDLLLQASFHDVANWTPNRKSPTIAENQSELAASRGKR